MEELSSNQGQRRLNGVGSVIFGSSLISLSPFLVEFSGLEAVANSFYRMGIGGLLLCAIALFRGEFWPPKRLLGLYFLAASTISLDLVIWNQSVLYIGSGLSTVLANLEIVFLVFIGTLFFRERLPSQFFLMLAFIVFGVCCLIYPYLFEYHANTLLGIVFGLAASFVYSLYLLILKTIRINYPDTSPISMLAMICLLGSLILGISILFIPTATFSIPHWTGFSYVLANGLLCQVIGWLLITRGLKQVSLSLSGLLMLVQPALTFIFDCLFFGRNTLWIQLVGCAILLAAVYGTTRTEKKEEALS